jgi:hypothetical protein
MNLRDSVFCRNFREQHRFFCNEYAPILSRFDSIDDDDDNFEHNFSRCCKKHHRWYGKKHGCGCDD